MSSFQIDLTPGLKPDVALLSNLTPDHIDRHGSMENYAAIKQRLLNQVPKDGQVIDRRGRRLCRRDLHPTCPATGVAGHRRSRSARCWAAASSWWMARFMTPRTARAAKVMDLSDARRICPARTIGRMRRWPFAATKPFVKDSAPSPRPSPAFPGLAHRMEDVGHIGKTRLHQRLQGHQCRRHGAGAGGLSRYFLDRGRQGQGGRHRKPRALFLPHPQGLSDRRGGACLRPHPGRQGAL